MVWFFVIIGCVLFGCLVYLENHTFDITPYELPVRDARYNGLRFVQVSDVHNASFGKDNQDLIAVIKEMKPDFILLTGDLFDAYHPNINRGLHVSEQCVQIAPTLYITGNHEPRIEGIETVIQTLESQGVIVLRNKAIRLEYQDTPIEFVGMEDASFYTEIREKDVMIPLIKPYFDALLTETDVFRVLLSHRPEMIPFYSAYPFDVGFSGHAHGGQWRIPLVGPLFAPEQGFFPKFTEGLHKTSYGTMIVSRGLGYSKLRFRLRNRPELVMVTLKKEADQDATSEMSDL